MTTEIVLDGLIADEVEDSMDWQRMGLAAFETDWENPDDAVYDKGLPPMAEKMAALDTKTYLEQRAQRGSREKLLTVLAQAPDVEPDPADRLAE